MSETAILIIYTGGTIGMIKDPLTGSLKPFDFQQIAEEVPLKKMGYKLSSIAFAPPIDSSNINHKDWVRIANILKNNYEKFDGFVVLHGTDTMSYSASALSFMLENNRKSVIFTGSQLPIGTLRTDGKDNLIAAIEIAASKINGKSIVPEVCIFFENQLYRGNRTTKNHAENFNAFRSENYPILAEAGIRINYNMAAIHYPVDNKKFNIHTKLTNNVAILKMFPGIGKLQVDAVLNIKNLKGLVLETYGSGNAPTDKWFIDGITNACKKGIVVLNVTQCAAGSVEMGRYQTSVELQKSGVISSYDITTEAAITKLMFVLGQNFSHDRAVELLKISISGEMTVN